MRNILFTLLLFSGILLLADITLSGGTSRPEIVIGEKPTQVIRFAADELAYFLGKSLGVAVAKKESSSAPVRIILGVAPDGKPVTEATWESHIEIRKDGTIYIYGYDFPIWGSATNAASLLFGVEYKGTLEATYAFLEDYLGVRWIEPGKAGEYIPKHTKLALPEVSRTISPTFTERRLYYLNQFNDAKHQKTMDEDEYGTSDDYLLWALRLRYSSNTARIKGCHTPNAMRFKQLLFPKRPELFALQPDGTRSSNDMCWSSQATKDFWWELVDAYFSGKPNPLTGQAKWPGGQKDEFMIDPHDYGKEFFCQCPKCREFIDKYGENGFGECIFQCIVDVARRTEAKYPDKFITTLVYKPKKMYPVSVELPQNLRVRMTIHNQSICSLESAYANEMELMKKWRTEQGAKLRLWMYLMSDHGHYIYGVPEFASTNFINFLRMAAPYSEGVFYEHIEPSHTVRNLDMYLIAHALYDVNFDMEKYAFEYFRIGFGAAADDMQEFYRRIERNWDKTMIARNEHPEITAVKGGLAIRKYVFNNIYTFDELEALQKIIDTAKSKVKGATPEYRRIHLYEKYVLALAKQEFPLHSDDKEHSFRQRPLLCCATITGEPTEDDWDAAPWQEMVNAFKGNPVNVKSRFKILCNDATFFFRADYEEPLIAQSRTRDDGDKLANLWEDNETELFFASEKTKKIMQICINDKGVVVVHDQSVHKFRLAGKEVRAQVVRGPDNWTITAAIDNTLCGFSPLAVEDAFNVVRARNVGKLKDEYYTYTPECIYGRWHMPILYPTIKRMPRNPLKLEYLDRALPPTGEPAETLVEDAVATGNGWASWVSPPGRSTFARDENRKHGKGASYMIDSTSEKPDAKVWPGHWQYTMRVPAKGTRIRATAWVLIQTIRPDAGVKLQVNWRNAKYGWYLKEDLKGYCITPVKAGEWTKVAMDIVVPDVDEIKFFSTSVRGENILPGKVWIGELKLETVK